MLKAKTDTKRFAMSAIGEMIQSLRQALPPRIGFITRSLPELLAHPTASRFLVARIIAMDDDVVIEHYLYYLRLMLGHKKVRAHINAEYFPLPWLECMILRHHMQVALEGDESESSITAHWGFLNEAGKLSLLSDSHSVSRDPLLCLQLISMLSSRAIEEFLGNRRDGLKFLNDMLERTPRELIRKLLLNSPEFTGFLLMIYETEGSRFAAIRALAPEMDYGRRIGSTIRRARANADSLYDERGRVNTARLMYMFRLIVETGEPARTLNMLSRAGCIAERCEYLYLEYLLGSRGA